MASLVLSVGGAIRANRDNICMKIDLQNTFNECSKAAILKVLEAEESLVHLTNFAAAILAPDVILESGWEMCGIAEEDVVQGDISSSAFVCVAQHASLIKLDQECDMGDSVKMVEVLSGSRQALWSMLRLSTMSRFENFCQLTSPLLSEPVSGMLDTHLWTVLEADMGFTVPRV